ncbi:Uncharacterised protein [Acinetobacter baumannii]|nr:Uncharacterised protein [Acinetobacter baumannii]
MHAVQQARAQAAARVRAGKVFRVETALAHQRHRQGVAHHQGIDRAGGGRQPHRAGFALNADIQYAGGGQRQRRLFAAGDGDHRNAVLRQQRQDQVQLFGAAGVGDEHHHVVGADHAEIAVQRLRRMNEERRRAGAGQRRGDFFADMAGLADAGNHRFAAAVQQQLAGADEIVIQARQQALRFGQLDLQRFAGEGKQGVGVTHRGLLPE